MFSSLELHYYGFTEKDFILFKLSIYKLNFNSHCSIIGSIIPTYEL